MANRTVAASIEIIPEPVAPSPSVDRGGPKMDALAAAPSPSVAVAQVCHASALGQSSSSASHPGAFGRNHAPSATVSLHREPCFGSHRWRKRSFPSFSPSPSSPSPSSVPGKSDNKGSPRGNPQETESHPLLQRDQFSLWKQIKIGYWWVATLVMLGVYGFFLVSGILQVAWYYTFSKRIHRNIPYGEGLRNKLDLYLPENIEDPKPVVAFVTGGAWVIGYKAWGCLLGQLLMERGVIVACIDYRNYPQATISDMIKDASKGISYICNNASKYGGDPNKIYLAGQSAGAHISACALVEQAQLEFSARETNLSWKASQIKGFFGLSGGYNLAKEADHIESRGHFRPLFERIMESEESFTRFSPELVVQSTSFNGAVAVLPPVYLFHGTADYSIPCVLSTSFTDALLSVGVEAKTILYPEKTHTDLFLLDPMRGGHNDLIADMLTIIHAGDPEAESKDAVALPRKRMVPEFFLQLANRISPF